MSAIDTKTLFYTYCFINTIIVPLIILYVIYYKVKTPVIKIFILARIFGVGAIFFMVLRGFIPDFLSITIANILLLFSISYEIFSFYSMDSTINKTHFKLVNLIPVILFIFFSFFISSNENTRIMVSSICVFIIYFIGAFSLLLNQSKTKIQKLAGYFLLIAGIVYFVRFLKALITTNSLLFSNDSIEVLSNFYILFLSLTTPILFLFILKEKDSQRIENDNLKLQELNDGKNKLLSIIAHDLRGPLGALQQIGELLCKDEENKQIDLETKKKLTENIYKTSKQTFNLLDNLLKWATTNSGKIEVNPTKINLKSITEEIISIYKTNTLVKNITIEHHLNDNLIVYADYNMINTVIRNIISNAIKFTSKYGKIEISSIDCTQTANFSCIAIKDTGVGIQKKDISKILNIDSSISTLGTENESGTGFGLKLCNEFVQKNNGEIKIESEKNKGTTVFIFLPNY